MADLAVIMSTYSNDKLEYLKESVFSILNQTYVNFIFYLAIDGPVSASCDNFLTNLEDRRIRIFRLKKNKGLAVALNLLLRNVLKEPGIEYIARMDADDISDPGRFMIQHQFLSANAGIECVGSWAKVINERGEKVADYILPRDHNSIKRLFLYRTPLIHPSVMFRRTMVEKIGYYPEDTFLMEDYYFWGKALRNGFKFANLPEFLLSYRIDNFFFRRRSGIKHAWNYVSNKFRINEIQKMSLTSFIFTIGMALIKMMPAVILQFLYFLGFKLRRLG
jgi:glycosyltransferase involved in cell wall biosynthesis